MRNKVLKPVFAYACTVACVAGVVAANNTALAHGSNDAVDHAILSELSSYIKGPIQDRIDRD